MSQQLIHQIVEDLLCLEAGSVHGDQNLFSDLDADSLDMVELLMDLEDHLDIEIEDEDFNKVLYVRDLYRFIP